MANLHFRVPVTLDVRLDVDDPVARVHKWRTWPDECPEDGEDLVLRFKLRGGIYTMIGYIDGPEFFDDANRPIFFDDGIYPEDFRPETVFDDRTPDVIHWIPLAELLEGVEEAES